MMRQSLITIDEARRLIASGRPLLLAADETALAQLPAGRWIAGTIPYFMAAAGGVTSRDRVFVTELPDEVAEVEIRTYDATSLRDLYSDAPANGFTVLIIPAGSVAHQAFALEAPTYRGFGVHPLVGWIAGVHLDELGTRTAKAFSGEARDADPTRAVAMHVHLPPTRAVEVGIVNLFHQGTGDTIKFAESGFSVGEAIINGERRNLAAYIRERGLDTRCPLVADYYGVGINVSIQAVDSDRVVFYAPVFADIEYRHASPVADYVAEFDAAMPQGSDIAFSCNCILNYLYSNLEGRRTSGVVGPATFGEIAYQLLNQTLVYMTLVDVTRS
jgi:hypothetical protein